MKTQSRLCAVYKVEPGFSSHLTQVGSFIKAEAQYNQRNQSTNKGKERGAVNVVCGL